MAKYTVSPPCGGFSCAFGSATPDENGVFEIDDPNVIEAMQAHGLTLTALPEPAGEPEPPMTEAQKKAAAKAAAKAEAEAKAAAEAAAAAAAGTGA